MSEINQKIAALANILSNDGFGEFDTYSKKMPLGDVKSAFKAAEAKIKTHGWNQAQEIAKLKTLKNFQITKGL
jgi:hypothetical protein